MQSAGLLFSNFRQRIPSQTLAMFLTLACGVILLFPFLTFQGFLSQGDHGRELACFEAVANGQMPYRDFFWNYGPLPLYFYALCMKIFGTSINAVLAGRLILNLISGVIVFRSLALFVPLRFASIGAIWFWFYNPDFHFTYCYTGGMTLLLAVTYFLFLYLKDARQKYLNLAMASVFLLCFVKINMGLAAWAGLLASVPIIDIWLARSGFRAPKTFYAFTLLAFPLFVVSTYGFFVYTMPVYAILQCFPYLPTPSAEHSTPYTSSAPAGLRLWLEATLRNITHSWKNAIMAVFLWLSIGLTGKWLFQKTTGSDAKKIFLAAMGILLTFYFLSLHEFLVSGLPYRAAWGQPFVFLAIFLFLGTGLRKIHQGIQTLLVLSLLLLVATTHLSYLKQLNIFKNSGKLFTTSRGELIVANPTNWIQIVQGATAYLKQHLGDQETFYVLPYDSLYYFLTGRSSPTWLYTFFIPHGYELSAQEGEIISDMNEHRVNYILISNRQKADAEAGHGAFGVHYGRLLRRYIDQNFKEVAHFGNWNAPAGWVEGHAVKIYKRNQSFPRK